MRMKIAVCERGSPNHGGSSDYRTGQGVTGHPFYGHGIDSHEGDISPVNGHTMHEQGNDSCRGIYGQGMSEWKTDGHGVDENGFPGGPDRCFCCPYGYHIDREFLGSLVRSSERNGANLQQLKKMHQRKLRHRQTMESLLMQSIPSSSGDFQHPDPEPVTPTTSDATESDVSLTEESSTNRDESTASSILSELDETIAEALRAIDELMNSKSRPKNYLLDAEVGSCSDTGNTSSTPSTPSAPDSSVPLKSHPELNPADLATEIPVEEHVRSSTPTIQDSKREGEAGKEASRVENRPSTTKAKPPPLFPKPLINSRMGGHGQSNSQLNNKMPTKISSLDADSVPNNSLGFLQMNEDTNLVKDASKKDRVFPTDEAQATRPMDDLSSSSDLTKALAVLLPIDGTVGTGTEALVRLRQYIVSSLRQMRILEQQVKTIPVMHVRLSVLKEEKKLLRLQLLSLQSALPSAPAPTGGLEDGIATPSPSPLNTPPTFTDRRHPYSSGDGSGFCSRCRGSITTERQATKSAISRQTSATNSSHPLVVSNFKDVCRIQQQKRQTEEANYDDYQLSTTGAEPRNKRQLCKSISLNPYLLFDKKINPTQQKPKDFSSQNIVDNLTALIPNSSTFHRRPETSFKRGLSLIEGAKTVYQRSRELREKIASETNLIRNRWNAKSLEKIAGFRSSPGQEPPKTFFNEPVKIRKVNLAKNTYPATTPPTTPPTTTPSTTTPPATTTTKPLLKPTPPHRQSFNAGIQCELLSTKTPVGTTCSQCHCVANPRKPISRDVPRVCDAISSSAATTINGRSLSQTPDVIVTHRQASLPGSRTQETGEGKENGRETNEDHRMDSYPSKSVSADAQLKVESKEVGCMTDEELYRVMKSETSTCTERSMFQSDSKDVGCLTDVPLGNVVTQEASTSTEMSTRDSKEVGCSIDLNLNEVVTRDAYTFTDKKLFKGNSKEVGCFTDVNLSQVETCEASSLTDQELLKGSSREIGCLTDVSLDKVFTQDASSFTENEMFKGNSKDVGCLTDTIQVITRDASCVTDNVLFKGNSKDVGCLTDISLNKVATLDASSLTERDMFPQDSKEVGCLTDVNLSPVITHDASSFTDKELFKGSSKEIGCLTDLNFSQVITHDASSFTDKELFKGSSNEIGCMTDMNMSQVVTRDASSFTDKELFKGYSKEIGCLTDMTLNQVVTHDASSFTDKELFKGYSKEVGCLTDVPTNDVTTRDAWSLTEKAMFKGYSKDVGCLTNVNLNKLSTRDAICFTEKEMLNQDSKDVSCMTDHIVIPTNDASCNTEISHSEGATQVCFSFQSIPTIKENSLSLTKLDSNLQTGEVASKTIGQCHACGSDKLSKRNTHEIGCNTDFVFYADDCNPSRLSDPAQSLGLCDGVGKTLTEVNNNVDKIVNLGEMKSRSENESVVSEVLLNNVENSNITCRHLESIAHSEKPKFVIQATSDSLSHHQTITTAAVESNANGDLVREKSRRVNLVLDGRTDAEKSAESADLSKITEEPSRPTLEIPALNERPSFHVGESFLNEKLSSACKTYSTWLQDSTEVNSKQLNGSLRVIQQEWFSVSSQKTSSSVHVKQLIDAFAKFSPDITKHVVNMVDTNENTALHYSISHQNFDLILFLLSTGICDVNRRNRAGCTAVMLASLVTLETDEQRATMRRLIEASDVNVTATLTGQTALMLAASRDHRETVRMLLEAKADPNVQDLDGSTALMCASEHGYIAVVRILLAHPGCDPSLCDNEGSTALSVAMEAGHRDIGVLLYAHINFRKQTSRASGRRHERKGSASNYKHP